MVADQSPYRMTISLDVLKHLGVGLYSNVPAVLSEAVANAWDADATCVGIDINDHQITIQDNGHGMTVDDANNRYLRVGYKRRREDDGGITPRLHRKTMGRKGIGKLSLFSVAKTVDVYSVKDGQRHGFRMNTDDIERSIKSGEQFYSPEQLGKGRVDFEEGTKIVLSDLKRRIYRSGHLKKRLARRFSVIAEDEFEVTIGGTPITPEDRAYYEKLQYIWTFGELGDAVALRVPNVKKYKRPSDLVVDNATERIDGWIGTVEKSGHTKDPGTNESLNAISIMVRGKMAQEDILEEFGEAGVYSTYVIGEIHADFLDADDQPDIATTGRQQLIEDDSRYQKLREKIGTELKLIKKDWTRLRNKDGPRKAFEIPGIKKWYESLEPDHRSMAKKLFGRINRYAIDDDRAKRRLFMGMVLTFEILKFRNFLDLLKEIKVDNLDNLGKVFRQLDEIELSSYYQITRQRLGLIHKLGELVDENAKEKVIQEHLYDHLWLLDPSWENAARTKRMESSVSKAFGDIDAKLTKKQKRSRLDIAYRTTGNKHVIIELKRPERALNSDDIQRQITKYRGAVINILKSQGRENEPVECVCVLGKPPTNWRDYPGAERESRDALEKFHARIVLYGQLLENAERSYMDYTENDENITRLNKLIQEIDPDDMDAMRRADA